MIRSSDRILTTHAGSLPRPDDLITMVYAKSRGQPYDTAALDARLPGAVAEVVARQAACGIDIVNDGEYGKVNFTNYARERIAGFEPRENPRNPYVSLDITARDDRRFPGYFEANPRPSSRAGLAPPICVGPLRYIGQDDVSRDIANFKAALDGVEVVGGFLPANTPGTIEHWMGNDYYATDEEFLAAIADVMHEEYKAITDAGLLLQIDDPDLPDGWNCLPDVSVADYRKYAALRVEALNHALRGIPPEQVRLHVCWGSFHGPHHDDIPLSDIADLIFSVEASIE